MARNLFAWLTASAFLVVACSSSTDDSGDHEKPTVTIDQSVTQSDPSNSVQVEFTATFSEPVTDFDSADLSFAGSTVGGTLQAIVANVFPNDGSTYSVTVFGWVGDGNVVVSIPAGGARDLAGNSNLASTSVDHTITVIDDAPTVTINQAPTQVDPINQAPVVFTVTFSEIVTGFTDSDVSFAGSTVGGTLSAAVTGTDGDYTVSVTGMTGNGQLVVSLPAGAAMDPAGNPSAASVSIDNTVTFDSSRPGVTINQAPAQADPTTSNTVQFAVQFSEPVTGFTANDVSLAGSTVGGSLTTVVTGDGTNFTVGVSGMTTNGTIVASIGANLAVDLAGNQNLASTSVDNTVTWQNTAPTVTINQAVTQPDPINQSPILFTAQFSEAVTGFGAGDISFAGSTAPGTLAATVTGTGPSYTVAVSGMTGNGTVVVSIPAASVIDAGGLGNSASTSVDNSVTFDNVSPTVTINQAAAQADPTAGATIQFTVVFSEPETGFSAADVSLTGSTVAGNLVVGVTGSGPLYTVSVTGMSGAGTVVASIPAGAARDLAGNPSLASTSVDNSVTHQ